MKSSIRAAVALGALALAATQANASIVYTDSSFVAGEHFHASPSISASAAIDDTYRFITPLSVGSETDALGFRLQGGAVSILNMSITWYEDGVQKAFQQVTDVTGQWLSTPTLIMNMLGGKTYDLQILGSGGTSGGQYDVAVSAVPLPAAAWLFGSALLGLGAMRRKQKAGDNSEMATA